MKNLKAITILSALGLCAISSSALAQRGGDPGGNPPIDPTPVVRPERPHPPRVIIERPVRPERPDRPDRPERPVRPALSDEMKGLIDQFASAREAFQEGQRDLLRSLREASAEERQQIREEIRSNAREFMDSQRELRREIRELMKEEFRNRREEIITDGRPQGRRGTD